MAYAALLSLSQILEQTLNHDYLYLILDEKQKLESLLKQVSSLQEQLENSSPKASEKMESLEKEIIDSAYKAEDIVESHIMKRLISEAPTSQRGESFTTFSEKIEKVVEDIDAAKNRMAKILEDDRVILHQQQLRTSISIDSSKNGPSSIMVGLDDHLLKNINTQLCGGSSDLQTIAFVGMGGIGKTTLAHNIYDHEYVKGYFDCCAWITLSQDYSLQKILLALVGYITITSSNMEGQENEKMRKKFETLKETVYKSLKSKRYLIVMDDVWETKFWDELKRLLPNDKNGSRIMITTRLENEVVCFKPNIWVHHIDLLNEDCCWQLFCQKVFGESSCPPELEKIGRMIVQHCGGLPLAVVVIGGLISNVTRTLDDWINFEENLKDALSASNDEHYSKIWSLSYRNLPHYLKGCFLYMGVFPEDFNIRASTLIKLWIAEGFVKPVRSKCLEEIAEGYLEDLTKRSLLLVSEWSSTGKLKTCKIHDLLREFCVKEAKRVMVLHVNGKGPNGIPQGICVRRSSIVQEIKHSWNRSEISTPLARSLFEFKGSAYTYPDFLRILHTHYSYSLSYEIPRLVNLRYIFTCYGNQYPPSLYKCQNLKTIILQAPSSFHEISVEPEFWKMAQLIHIQLEASLNLPAPPSAESSMIVLKNLRTLSIVKNFRCTEAVVLRIPNVNKLGIYYADEPTEWGNFYLQNLVSLQKLETLKCLFESPSPSFLKNVTFPTSLKKLTLIGGELCWEDMKIVGSLPNLQVLKLKDNAFSGPNWETKKGRFAQLEFLLLDDISLQHWVADEDCFQHLQRLVIKNCYDLQEIPIGFAYIPMLQLIELHCCGNELIESAERIQASGDGVLKVVIKKEQRRYLSCLSHSSFMQNQPFPASMEKITLRACRLFWEDMRILGVLPNLKVLKLKKDSFIGPQWEASDDQFLRLEFLLLEEIKFESWCTVSENFPRLQHLVVKRCNHLENIPHDIGYIPTFRSIVVHDCRQHSLVHSARQIKEEQQKMGNYELEVQIINSDKYFSYW